jgi:hypothetical protein
MTSPSQEHAKDTNDRETKGLDLSVTQLLAGALAAVSSAVAASYFGVAGTLLGAAVGSVIGTVATAVYKHSLARTTEKVREIVPIQTVVLRPLSDTTRRLRANGGNGAPENSPPDGTGAPGPHVETVRFAGGTEAPGHPAMATGSTESAPTDLPDGTTVAGAVTGGTPDEAAGTGTGDAPAGSRSWARTAVLALAAFALALGVVTAVELIGNRPLSAWITGNQERGTTVGTVTGGRPASVQRATPPPTPTASPTATPTATPTASPSVTPSASPSSESSPSVPALPSASPSTPQAGASPTSTPGPVSSSSGPVPAVVP